MIKAYDEEISLSGPMFAPMRSRGDEVLGVMLRNTWENSQDEAVMVIKIKYKLRRDRARDPWGGEGAKRDILVPEFSFSVSSVLKSETKVEGTVAGNYELVLDEDENKFVRRPVDDGQLSLFSEDETALSAAARMRESAEERVHSAELRIAENLARREGRISVARLREELPGIGAFQAAMILDEMQSLGLIEENGRFASVARLVPAEEQTGT